MQLLRNMKTTYLINNCEVKKETYERWLSSIDPHNVKRIDPKEVQRIKEFTEAILNKSGL
jgi:hypothetical protein